MRHNPRVASCDSQPNTQSQSDGSMASLAGRKEHRVPFPRVVTHTYILFYAVRSAHWTPQMVFSSHQAHPSIHQPHYRLQLPPQLAKPTRQKSEVISAPTYLLHFGQKKESKRKAKPKWKLQPQPSPTTPSCLPTFLLLSQMASLFVFVLLLVAGVHGKMLGAPIYASFSLDFFPKAGATKEIALYGGAVVNATSGAMSMSGEGRVAYKKPITFVGRSPGFSTYFSFSLSAYSASAASLAFFLKPAASSANSPSVVAVVFATEPRTENTTTSQIRIDLADETVVQTGDLGSRGIPFANAIKLYSWIDYNGTTNALQIRLARLRTPKPAAALLSYPIDLSTVLWRKPMVVGFTSSAKNCSLFSWAFQAKHGHPFLMHSEPLDPSDFLATAPPERGHRARERGHYAWGVLMSLVFAAACGAMVTFFTLFIWFSVVARRPVAPVEYPVHPSDVVYEKIVLVGVKDHAAAAGAAGDKK